jgi:hypothetical protein
VGERGGYDLLLIDEHSKPLDGSQPNQWPRKQRTDNAFESLKPALLLNPCQPLGPQHDSVCELRQIS